MESQQTKAGPSKGTESENGDRTPSPVVSPASSEIVVLQEIDNSIPTSEQTGEPESADKIDNTSKETAEKANDNPPEIRVVRGCCRKCRNNYRNEQAEVLIDEDGQGDKDQYEPCCRGFRKGMMRRSLQFCGKTKPCHGRRFCHKDMGEAQKPCCKPSKEKCGDDFASEEMAGRWKKRGGFKRCFGRQFGNRSDPEGLVDETHHDSSSDNEDAPRDRWHGKKHGFRKCFKKGHEGHSDPEGFEQDNEAGKCHRKKRDITSDAEGNVVDIRHGKMCKKHFQMRHGGHSETEGYFSEQANEARKCHRVRRDIASDTEGNTADGRHEKRSKCKKRFQMRHGGHSETEGFTSERDNQTRKCNRKRCCSSDVSHEKRNKKHFHVRHGGHSETEGNEQDDDARNCCHKGKQTDATENVECCDQNAFSGRHDLRQLFWSLMNNQNMHHGSGRFGKMGKHFGHHMKHGGGRLGKMGKHFGHHMKHGGGRLGKMGKHFGHHMKHGGGRFGKMDKHHFGHHMKHGGGCFGEMGSRFGHHMKHGHHGRHGFLNKHGRFGHEQSGHYQRINEPVDTLPDAVVIVLE